ncbi:beta-microseminoprotein-like [Syngnathus scovelli]|uniref:beta-microseminoprotein-like n=1 Tax=Syngnathus scovelli TaxID=161590 RepID=UPI00211052C4|nr:beta-microseminoprotein J1-like [Syngnathus scovelli]
MRTYLCLAFLLCALLPLANGECYPIQVAAGATQCQDPADNEWHAVGSSWRNGQCMDCTCDGCCTAFTLPRGFPDDCVSVFDKATCKYSVHRRDDP